MVVNVDQIEEEGLSLEETVDVALVERALRSDGRDTGFRPLNGFSLKASFQKLSGGVLLRAAFKAPLGAPCKRCLTDVAVSLPVEFTLNLVPTEGEGPSDGAAEDDEESGTAGSFHLGEADEEPFDGKTIDVDPILREQLLLALPMYVVCREDCRGMCGSCGKNLNEEQCVCQRDVIDPRLAVLKDIKLN